MLGEEMKIPCQAAGGLTDQGKERAFGFSSNTVITPESWTLIWECGGFVNPVLQTDGNSGLSCCVRQFDFRPYFEKSTTHHVIRGEVECIVVTGSLPKCFH